MKKITLISILTFALITGVIFISSNISSKKELGAQFKVSGINPIKINIKDIRANAKSTPSNTFTLNEVSKHNARNDCYLIINNNVYDVSSYIDYHPGGQRTITSNCGKEVTGLFASIHSNWAWDLLKKYKIGTIYISKPKATPKTLDAISKALKASNPNSEIIKVVPRLNFYIAKLIFNGKLYEIHINSSGKIIKEEVESNEKDWSNFEKDNDDE